MAAVLLVLLPCLLYSIPLALRKGELFSYFFLLGKLLDRAGEETESGLLESESMPFNKAPSVSAPPLYSEQPLNSQPPCSQRETRTVRGWCCSAN